MNDLARFLLIALALPTACSSTDDPASTAEGTSDSSGSADTAADTAADDTVAGDTAADDTAASTTGEDPDDGTTTVDTVSGGTTIDDDGDSSSGTDDTTASDESSSSESGVELPPFEAEWYVDAADGSDDNDGSFESPFRTITFALTQAQSGHRVGVLPGDYDAPHGELFPITIPFGVILIGDQENRGLGPVPTRILGNGTIDQDYTAAVSMQATSQILGFAISSSAVLASFGVDVGVDATIANNTFDFSYGGIHLAAGSPEIRDSTFLTTYYGIRGVGTAQIEGNHFVDGSFPIDLLGGASEVRDNLIEGSGNVGVQNAGGSAFIVDNVFNNDAYTNGCLGLQDSPVVRDNECNVTSGLAVRIFGGTPDLGTFVDPGGNLLGSQDAVGIVHQGSEFVNAQGNTWANDPVSCKVDIELSGGGTVQYAFSLFCS